MSWWGSSVIDGGYREDTRVSWESPEVVVGGEDVVGKGLSVGTSVGVVE